MKVDLTKPVIVLLGSWNPGIFNPGWCAHHLFGHATGTDVLVTSVVSVDQQPQRALNFIDKVGWSINGKRLEIYVQDIEEATLARAENISIKTYEKLPHTPLGAFGINVSYVESEIPERIFEMLRTTDGLDARFRVLEQAITTTTQYDENTTLKLKRELRGVDQLMISFNFNQLSITPAESDAKIKGKLGMYLKTSNELLNELYGLEVEGIVGLEEIERI
jgi:hypothetical protein